MTNPDPAAVIQHGDGIVLLGRDARDRTLRSLFEAGDRSLFPVSAG
jgi:K+/H+ antiporter YhaU regulatory subunit KhtT